jgi:hypothetical protein
MCQEACCRVPCASSVQVWAHSEASAEHGFDRQVSWHSPVDYCRLLVSILTWEARCGGGKTEQELPIYDFSKNCVCVCVCVCVVANTSCNQIVFSIAKKVFN